MRLFFILAAVLAVAAAEVGETSKLKEENKEILRVYAQIF